MNTNVGKYLLMIAGTMLFDLILSTFLLHHGLMEEGNTLYAIYLTELGIKGLVLQKIIMNGGALVVFLMIWKFRIMTETRLEYYCAFAAWVQFGILAGSILGQLVLLAADNVLLARFNH